MNRRRFVFRHDQFKAAFMEHALSVRMIAERLGVSISTISRWMNGERVPVEKYHDRIATLCGRQKSELFMTPGEAARHGLYQPPNPGGKVSG